MPKRLPTQSYIEGVRRGDRVVLSQAITLVESTRPADRKLAGEVIEALMPDTGQSFRLGITGVPGVGKSTFIDAFGQHLTRLGHRVAVLAIDPSSHVSRGSILGDKTRMDRLSHDPNAYVRPSPTGGSLGGVARQTRETLLLCEAAGYDVIFIETVGVGQSEIAVHSMVDFFLLLMLPNAGDELQGIKKGIMEMADAVVINKADGEYQGAARQAQVSYGQALRLFPLAASGWRPEVLTCSALKDEGLDRVWDCLTRYQSRTQANHYWQERRRRQAIQWMDETIQHLLDWAFHQDPSVKGQLADIRAAVGQGMQSPTQAAEHLVQRWLRRAD
jgi:LAO/AO transport system kinase